MGSNRTMVVAANETASVIGDDACSRLDRYATGSSTRSFGQLFGNKPGYKLGGWSIARLVKQ